VTIDTTTGTDQPQDAAPSDLELLVNETVAEGRTLDGLPDGAVLVSLYEKDGTTLVHEFAVLHPDDWPASANEDPDQRRIYTWALKVLATDDDKAMWRAIDPTNRQANQFINSWIRAAGVDPKDAAAANGSSGSTPRR
jgi:hypothetical protein